MNKFSAKLQSSMTRTLSWLVLVFFVCHCRAGNFYVSVNSNSTTNCGTESNPCSTIQAGITAACGSGTTSTIWVGPGTYVTQSNITWTCSDISLR